MSRCLVLGLPRTRLKSCALGSSSPDANHPWCNHGLGGSAGSFTWSHDSKVLSSGAKWWPRNDPGSSGALCSGSCARPPSARALPSFPILRGLQRPVLRQSTREQRGPSLCGPLVEGGVWVVAPIVRRVTSWLRCAPARSTAPHPPYPISSLHSTGTLVTHWWHWCHKFRILPLYPICDRGRGQLAGANVHRPRKGLGPSARACPRSCHGRHSGEAAWVEKVIVKQDKRSRTASHGPRPLWSPCACSHVVDDPGLAHRDT